MRRLQRGLASPVVPSALPVRPRPGERAALPRTAARGASTEPAAAGRTIHSEGEFHGHRSRPHPPSRRAFGPPCGARGRARRHSGRSPPRHGAGLGARGPAVGHGRGAGRDRRLRARRQPRSGDPAHGLPARGRFPPRPRGCGRLGGGRAHHDHLARRRGHDGRSLALPVGERGIGAPETCGRHPAALGRAAAQPARPNHRSLGRAARGGRSGRRLRLLHLCPDGPRVRLRADQEGRPAGLGGGHPHAEGGRGHGLFREGAGAARGGRPPLRDRPGCRGRDLPDRRGRRSRASPRPTCPAPPGRWRRRCRSSARSSTTAPGRAGRRPTMRAAPRCASTRCAPDGSLPRPRSGSRQAQARKKATVMAAPTATMARRSGPVRRILRARCAPA